MFGIFLDIQENAEWPRFWPTPHNCLCASDSVNSATLCTCIFFIVVRFLCIAYAEFRIEGVHPSNVLPYPPVPLFIHSLPSSHFLFPPLELGDLRERCEASKFRSVHAAVCVYAVYRVLSCVLGIDRCDRCVL